VDLIAIGNGTASRETDKLAADLMQRVRRSRLTRHDKVVVSEAGASVYSASEFACQELPELDVSLRGAVSIARRLQDPLAELVKIDPKSHRRRPVPARRQPVRALARSLDAVVEDCVNAVGVDLNTASRAAAGARVGPRRRLAAQHRALARRARRLPQSASSCWTCRAWAPTTFEQAAGFLRIRDGDNPLDMTRRCTRRPTRWCERILADIRATRDAS
jgi:uncharacterized protein